MNEKVEQILELPLHWRVGILLGSVLVIALGYYFFIYPSLGEGIAENKETIERLRAEIAEKQLIAANLGKFEEEVERLDIELKKALKELPDRREIDMLLARVSDRARDAGLDIQLFQPQPDQLKDFYAEVPVQIQVWGTYHEVGTFFDEVAHLERIVNVDQFDMGFPSVTEEEVLIKTTAVATSFRFLEENERPAEDSKKRKRRRRRSSGE